MSFESGVLKRLDFYIRMAMEALEDGDCEKSFKAIIRANALHGAAQGAIVVRNGGGKAGLAAARRHPYLSDARRLLKILETSYQERCWGGRAMMHGLGAPHRRTSKLPRFMAEGRLPQEDDLKTRVAKLLDNVQDHLDNGDCVETFYAIRDAANYIMYMTAMMKLVARGTGSVVISDKTVERSVMKFLAPLESLEKEFVEQCVKGGEGRARGTEYH